jgi:hypothetical protein
MQEEELGGTLRGGKKLRVIYGTDREKRDEYLYSEQEWRD